MLGQLMMDGCRHGWTYGSIEEPQLLLLVVALGVTPRLFSS